jgi:hypothetical protein
VRTFFPVKLEVHSTLGKRESLFAEAASSLGESSGAMAELSGGFSELVGDGCYSLDNATHHGKS